MTGLRTNALSVFSWLRCYQMLRKAGVFGEPEIRWFAEPAAASGSAEKCKKSSNKQLASGKGKGYCIFHVFFSSKESKQDQWSQRYDAYLVLLKS